MNTHIFIQARLGSKRLPSKALRKICNKTIIELMVERLRRVQNIQKIILVTGHEKDNSLLVEEARRLKIDYFCGSEENILDRFYKAQNFFKSDVIIRVMADSPLIDHELINEGLDTFFKLQSKIDILSIDRVKSYPHGLNFQIFTSEALKKSWEEHFKKFNDLKKFDQEFISPAMYMLVKKQFKNYDLIGKTDYSSIRLTLDYPEDFEVVKNIFEKIYPRKPNFVLKDILEVLDNNPKLLKINEKYHTESDFTINYEK